jgi:hypothetical protein
MSKEDQKALEKALKKEQVVRKAIAHPDYMFGRTSRYGGINIIHRDPTSPSGRISRAFCSDELFEKLSAEVGESTQAQPIVQLGEW